MSESLADLVVAAAEARGEPLAARKFIDEAIRQCNAGEAVVRTYPTGQPTLKGLHELATTLEAQAAVKN